MRHLDKTTSLNIRFTPAQKAAVRKAARKISGERGERVDPGTLVRELVMPAIQQILQSEAA